MWKLDQLLTQFKHKLVETELKENDLLLVTKIDRCSRNTLDFLKLQEKFFQKSVIFISLDLPYSNDLEYTPNTH